MATTTALLQARSLSPGLTVNDLQRSRDFYVDGLGFTVEQEVAGENGDIAFIDLVAGNARLGLSQDDFAKGRDRIKGVGMRIFVETEQDIEALARQARDARIEVDGPRELPWGPTGFTVTDPDGFKLTISKPV